MQYHQTLTFPHWLRQHIWLTYVYAHIQKLTTSVYAHIRKWSASIYAHIRKWSTFRICAYTEVDTYMKVDHFRICAYTKVDHFRICTYTKMVGFHICAYTEADHIHICAYTEADHFHICTYTEAGPFSYICAYTKVNFRVAFLSSISRRCIRFHSKHYHMLVGYMKCETLSVKERTLVECMHLVKNASCMPQAIVTKFEFKIEFNSI
jgi:hypothetical protein